MSAYNDQDALSGLVSTMITSEGRALFVYSLLITLAERLLSGGATANKHHC